MGTDPQEEPRLGLEFPSEDAFLFNCLDKESHAQDSCTLAMGQQTDYLISVNLAHNLQAILHGQSMDVRKQTNHVSSPCPCKREKLGRPHRSRFDSD